jgi:acyl-homoserine lactone acylase PvdQ
MNKKIASALLVSASLFTSFSSLPIAIAQTTKVAPQPDLKTVSLQGLRDRVTVRRDQRGIPYIQAKLLIACGRWI